MTLSPFVVEIYSEVGAEADISIVYEYCLQDGFFYSPALETMIQCCQYSSLNQNCQGTINFVFFVTILMSISTVTHLEEILHSDT